MFDPSFQSLPFKGSCRGTVRTRKSSLAAKNIRSVRRAVVLISPSQIVCCTGSAHLLGRLINACPRLVLPYVSPILKALVAKLRAAPHLQITAAGPSGTAAKATLVQGISSCCSQVLWWTLEVPDSSTPSTVQKQLMLVELGFRAGQVRGLNWQTSEHLTKHTPTRVSFPVSTL